MGNDSHEHAEKLYRREDGDERRGEMVGGGMERRRKGEGRGNGRRRGKGRREER